MFPNRKTISYILLFLILLIGILFILYKQNGKQLIVMNHSTKVVYPDLKTSPKDVFNVFQQELEETIQYDLEEMIVTEDKQLTQKIDQILELPQLEGALVGISVRKGETGELLYENLGNIRLRPASNIKILTAVAALETLGEDYQFTTDVLTDGEIIENVLEGNIYIKGHGDPTILKEDFDQFAKDLKELGISKITGNIIGDDFWYDDIRYSQDLNWSDEYNYTGSAISALTVSPNKDYNAGTVVIRVYPNETIGDPPEIKVIPETDYIQITNDAKTVRKQDWEDLSIERVHGTNNFIIGGSITANSPIEVWRSVWEPTDLALYIFKDSLEEQGIDLSNESRMERDETPKGSKVLLSKKSIPLEELMIPFMKLSNNTHGEILVKEMGKVIYNEGSWDMGLQVMEDQLSNLHVNTNNILLRDGSGMSFKNLIPPNELTKLLYEVQAKDWYQTFLDSQPVSGENNHLIGGTLSYRLADEMTKGKVRAKTGTLTGVSTLSGYLTNQGGEELIFSIMINNYIDGWMPSIQDMIVEILVEHENE